MYQSKMWCHLSHPLPGDKYESKQDLVVASIRVVRLLWSLPCQTRSSLQTLGDAQIQPAINSPGSKGGRSSRQPLCQGTEALPPLPPGLKHSGGI